MAWERQRQSIFLSGGLDLCPCSAVVTSGAEKLFGLGFYLLLFPPCFARGVSFPEGQPGVQGQFAAKLLTGGRWKAMIQQEHLLIFILRARKKNLQGKPEHPWCPSPGGGSCTQTEGVSAPSGGSSSSVSSPRTPEHRFGLLHPSHSSLLLTFIQTGTSTPRASHTLLHRVNIAAMFPGQAAPSCSRQRNSVQMC